MIARLVPVLSDSRGRGRITAFSALLLLMTSTGLDAAEPAGAPKELARKWRFVCWQNDFSGIGLAEFAIEVADGKVKLGVMPDSIRQRSRSVSDLDFRDGTLRFKLTYDTSVDDTRTQPLRHEWFEGRFDPKFPDRLWGVLGPKNPTDDDAAFRHDSLRAAELSPVPGEPETMVTIDAKTGAKRVIEDFRWAMPSAMSPGLGTIEIELRAARRELETGAKRPDDKLPPSAYFAVLDELAANRKANRRGYRMLRSLVENAHLASVAPERVSGWLGEILDYTAPYGPRFARQLRADLARQLEKGKEAEYEPLIEKLRSGAPFTPTARR